MPPFSKPRSFQRPQQHRTVFSPLVKRLARLKKDRGRLEASEFLIEGPKFIQDILRINPDVIREVYCTPVTPQSETMADLKKHKVRLKKISEDEMRFLSETETHQGLLALARFSTLKPNWSSARYVTLLDAVQDPGNVGAIFRTSVALGMDALLLGRGTCEAYNPKVVRASAGSLLKIPFEAGVDLSSKISFLRQKGFSIVATSPRSLYTWDNIKLRKKVALLLGNEGRGVDEKIRSAADAEIHLPIKNVVESLNVSVAHGILSYQLLNSRT